MATQEEVVRVGPGRILFSAETVARYEIRAEGEIIVDPIPGVSEANMRLMLLGTAFGLLLLERGFIPLHANAVTYSGGGFAFVGPSGIGKSTLAAHLSKLGLEVLCDDVCAVNFDGNGHALAWPSLPRLKLWQDATRLFGYDCKELVRIHDGLEKYHVPLPRWQDFRPFPLKQIYVLRDAEGAQIEPITQLKGLRALRGVMNNVYRCEYFEALGLVGPGFERSARLANAVAVYDAPRVRGYDVFEREADRLIRHMQDRVLQMQGAAD